MLVISSQLESGNLKQLIVYVSIAWATTLIRISLLALDKSFSFQPTSLFANFSLRPQKVLHLNRPI